MHMEQKSVAILSELTAISLHRKATFAIVKLWQLEECNLFTQQRIFTHAVVQEVSEWEIPTSRVVKIMVTTWLLIFVITFSVKTNLGSQK